jgi:small subunit ribosomal protein S6
MNRYENIVIIDADVGEDDKKALMERLDAQISRRNGVLIEFDDWGMRKMAYEIRKKRQGQYLRIDFCGEGELVSAMERTLGHDHRILRFMTVRTDQDVDHESIKAEKQPQQEEEKPAQAAEPEVSETQTPQAPDQAEEPAPEEAEEKE